MTRPCPNCDRADCKLPIGIDLYGDRLSGEDLRDRVTYELIERDVLSNRSVLPAWMEQAIAIVKDCNAHAVNWRDLALAAEARLHPTAIAVLLDAYTAGTLSEGVAAQALGVHRVELRRLADERREKSSPIPPESVKKFIDATTKQPRPIADRRPHKVVKTP